MKINIQKIVKLGTTFCAVLALVLFSFAPRSYAVDIEPTVVTVNAMDHIEDIVIDGDVKTVYFKFLAPKYRVNTWIQPSGTKSFVFGKDTGAPYFLTLPDGTTSFVSRVYLFGSEAYENQPAPVGVLDVSDIMPGASLDLTIGYDMTLAATLTGSVRYTQGAFLYDADGGYVDVVYVAENATNLSVDGAFNQKFDLPGTLILPHDVSYVLPFTSISFTCEDGSDPGGVTVTFVPYTLEMSVDINMIYENSQTMDAIKDQLGDISQGIQDTNDKLDDVSQGIQDTNDRLDDVNDQMADTNDKLDTIIDGTPEQQAIAAEKSGEAANMRDQVQDMIGQKDSVVKPDAADIDMDISDVLDDDSVSMLTSSVAPIYDMPIVTNYFAVFGSILVVSFILFGKKR